ncbi:hypothetical protein F5Y05DRAFT_324553 [Hypoxylon sp. FL0543]|nr:hypothetical protein F5Y05DRAFT_324553 [Hypoxylon sp. FL0543]
MAPTSKSTSPSSKSTANANPAPDFTVNMNRIQTQFEAHLKAVRSFLPPRSHLNNNSANSNSNATSRSFSALSTSANPTDPKAQDATSAATAAARRAAQEAEFAEERALDPNAGLGHVRAPAGNKNGNDAARDPETAKLRGRLLGKRGSLGPNGDGQQKWVRKDESSDEEPGRSGLGRAKKNGKRSRAEMEADDGAKRGSDVHVDTPPEVNSRTAEGAEDPIHQANASGNVTEDLASKPRGEDELNKALTEGNSKKKRRKKRKKRAKETPDKD